MRLQIDITFVGIPQTPFFDGVAQLKRAVGLLSMATRRGCCSHSRAPTSHGEWESKRGRGRGGERERGEWEREREGERRRAIGIPEIKSKRMNAVTVDSFNKNLFGGVVHARYWIAYVPHAPHVPPERGMNLIKHFAFVCLFPFFPISDFAA